MNLPHALEPGRRRDRSPSRKRSLLAIPVLGLLILAMLWAAIFNRLAAEKDAVDHASMASAAILSAALEQHTIRAIHQVDQITRFVKYEYEKSPAHFDLIGTVRKGVIPSDTLVQVSIIDEHGRLIANTEQAHPQPIDLSDREHFKIHERVNDDLLYISKPVLGRVSKQWTLQMTRRLNHADGSFAGVVVVSENPAYFTSDFYNNAGIGRDSVVAVVSDSGAILARRTGDAQNSASRFSATGQYPVDHRISGIMRDPLDGVLRVVSYRHLDGYPLGVLVGLSEHEELADYRHTRNIYLLMASFISIAMIGFFAVATGLIAKLLGREREMAHLIEYDALTGLPNRFQTLRSLQHDMAQPGHVGRLALLLIDLDNFKAVNDALGHNAGDIVLQMVATRLRDALGHKTFLSRVGGDEFLVVLKGDHVAQTSTKLAETIIAMLRTPFEVRDTSFVLRASIGIALHGTARDSEIDLLRKADLAMYSAKDAGQDHHAFYSPQLAHSVDHRVKTEQALRAALAEQQLFLAYQPKVDLQRRRITGFEALARWNHPQHGVLTASEFIPIAESTGLIVPLGEFVIECACRQLGLWQREGYRSLTLAVNISSMQFWRGDLIATVERHLRRYEVPPHRLELEITETAMMEYPELVSEKIIALKKLGVRIALDDFGTGYSSLSYLNRFSISTLKVDRSFMRAIPGDPSVCVTVSAIVNLARSLGLTTVIEGVETDEQLAWLSSLGGIEAQGFLFSRPVPNDALPALFKRFGLHALSALGTPEAIDG